MLPFGISPIGQTVITAFPRAGGSGAEEPPWSDDPVERVDFSLRQSSAHHDSVDWEMRAYWSLLHRLDVRPPARTVTPSRVWNELVVAPFVTALQTIEAGSPGSVLPRFPNGRENNVWDEPLGQRWVSVYALHDRDAGLTAPGPTRGSIGEQFDVRFMELRTIGPPSGAADPAAPVAADLPRFLGHDGRPVRRSFRFASVPGESGCFRPPAWDQGGQVVPRVLLALQDDTGADPAATTPVTVRVGALDLEFSAHTAGSTMPPQKVGQIEVSLAFLGSSDNRFPPPPSGVRCDLYLQVARFGPGGQDRNPGASDDAAEAGSLIVPVLGRSNWVEGRYLLLARESIRPGRDHKLAMRLDRAQGGSQGTAGAAAASASPDLNFLVVQFAPMLVAQVLADVNLVAGHEGEIGQFVSVAGEPSGWRLQDTQSGFRLLLPPQAVGEEMIKDYLQQSPPGPGRGRAFAAGRSTFGSRHRPGSSCSGA